MILIYHLFRYLFLAGIRIASIQNTKAKRWLEGRKNWKENIIRRWKVSPSEKVVWMHCASVGEFEQGRPILESIRKMYPHTKVAISFFSPSGYEAKKNYEGADLVTYLPFDGKKNAQEFISLLQPTLVIFVKYEFWYFYLTILKNKQIPVILASGLFRKSQPFFKEWGSFHRKMLGSFTRLFVQNEESVRLLQSIHLHQQTEITGDTRFDRVVKIASEKITLPLIENYCTTKTLIAGSTWPEDEALLKEWHLLQPNWNLMIIPHEISSAHLEKLKVLYPGSICLSEIPEQNEKIENAILIIDKMGILSKIYKYADLCYIGGGLKKSGHHNILEAAVYGKAVITGPYIHKFSESVALHNAGGSFLVNSGKELFAISSNEDKWEKAGQIAFAFVQSHLGATEKIMSWIQEKRLLSKE
jgi:3-deoxy-D-manno-octulosonic-acid transferase